MRTISIQNIDMNSGAETLLSTQISDAFTEFLQTPVTKLDADQYIAEDLDGVTESLFGSGNLNFMMLQAGQTDGALNLNNPYMLQANEDTSLASLGTDFALRPVAAAGAGNEKTDLGSERPLETQAGNDNGTALPAGHFASSAAAPGASGFAAHSGEDGFSSRRINSNPGTDGGDGAGTSGIDGRNGTDGNPTGDTFNNFNETNIFDGDNLTDIVTNTINSTATTVQTNITNIINQLFPGDDGVNPPDTDLDIGGIGAAPLDLVIDPIEDLIGDIDLGLGVGSLLGDGETDNGAGDTDLGLGGNLQLMGSGLALPQLNIALDPIESLLGDIDLDLAAAGNLLGALAPGLFDNAEGGTGLDTVGSTLNGATTPIAGDLLGGGDNDGGTDSDLTFGSDIGLDGLGLGGIVDDAGLGDALDQAGALIEQSGLDAVTDQIDISGMLDQTGVGDIVDQLGLGIGLDTIPDLNPSDIVGNLGDVGGMLDNLPVSDGTQDIVLDAVEDLVGDIDIGGGLNLMGTGETSNANGDSDLNLNTGLDLADNGLSDLVFDLPLDALEDVVGDLDLNLNLGTDLFGHSADPLVNDGEGGTGDETLFSTTGDDLGGISQGIIGSLHENGATLPDFDLSDINDALGGMNNDIIAAVDLLPQSGNEGPSTGGGNILEDIQGWTENLIPDSGGLLGGLGGLGGFGGGAGNTLPDPIGSVSEGLGGLLDSGSLGASGLFGGSQSGGLFG